MQFWDLTVILLDITFGGLFLRTYPLQKKKEHCTFEIIKKNKTKTCLKIKKNVLKIKE